MFTDTYIFKIVRANAEKLDIDAETLGKLDVLIASSIYDVIHSREFVKDVRNELADEARRIARGYGK